MLPIIVFIFSLTLILSAILCLCLRVQYYWFRAGIQWYVYGWPVFARVCAFQPCMPGSWRSLNYTWDSLINWVHIQTTQKIIHPGHTVYCGKLYWGLFRDIHNYGIVYLSLFITLFIIINLLIVYYSHKKNAKNITFISNQ